MSRVENSRSRADNRLLAELVRADHQRLAPHLEPVLLDFKQVLCEPGAAITHVYFPQGSMVSLVNHGGNGTGIEVGTVGLEGMAGLPVFLGAGTATNQYLVQVAGKAQRLKSDVFREESRRRGELHDLLARYTHAFLIESQQLVACNGLHSVKQRCCRWLLESRDRVAADEFPLTQEFFAQMLGVRRASIAEVARSLQSDGLIRYRRGLIAILDRRGLEKLACECYGIIRAAYEQMLARP